MSGKFESFDVTNDEAYLIYLQFIIGFILVRCKKNSSEFTVSPNCKDVYPYNIAICWKKDEEMKHRLISCYHMHPDKDIKDILKLSKCLKGYEKIKVNPHYSSIEYYDLIKCTNYSDPQKICSCEKDELLNTILHCQFNNKKKICHVVETRKPKSMQLENCGCSEIVFNEFKDKIKHWIFTYDEVKIFSETKDLFDEDLAEKFVNKLKNMVEETLQLDTTEGISHDHIIKMQNSMVRDKYRKKLFNFKDPVQRFCGRLEEMDKLKKCDHIAVIHGPEGIGKTELAKKFASLMRYDFNIWINAQSQESIKNDLKNIAFNKLYISEKDYDGHAKDIKTILREICFVLEPDSGKILFIFDDAKENIELISSLDNHFILITTRENDIIGPKVELNGFSESEAIAYVADSLENENEFDILSLVQRCNFIPRKIKEEMVQLEKDIFRNRILNPEDSM